MNYRHTFHAGNFADVMKHATLVRILEYLRTKPAPFRVIDTHAGSGRYDLAGAEASRSGEWRDGIARLRTSAQPEPAAILLAPTLKPFRP
jgi:23S rRNA (adenine2030-N6)-methyltransferase